MQQTHHRKHYLVPLITAGYGLLIAYATLLPLSGWQWPGGDNWFNLFEGRPRYLSKADVITNFLVYMPFGLLLTLSLRRRLGRLAAVGVAILAGASLSLTLESLQLFLPNRISSLTDILMNTLGTVVGGILAFTLSPYTAFGRRLRRFRQYWFRSGRLADLGLVILGLWALSQLSPLLPSFEDLRSSIKPLLHTLQYPAPLDGQRLVVYALYVGGLGFLANTLRQPGRDLRRIFPIFAISVLLLKAPVVGQQISAEAVLGLVIGIIIFLAGSQLDRRRSIHIAFGLILGGYLVSEIGFTGTYALGYSRPFNWLPFRSQIGDVTRLADIAAAMWPFMALTYLTLALRPRRPLNTAIWGAVIVFVGTMALEWYQQRLPGRYPDITNVLLAVLAWITPWLHPVLRKRRGQTQPTKA